MIAFILGLVIGGALGVLIMCLMILSGEDDRSRKKKDKERNQNG